MSHQDEVVVNVDDMFSRENIEKVPNLKIVDKVNNLDLFCYDNISENQVRQYRGIVFHNNTLVMRGLSHPIELDSEECLFYMNNPSKDDQENSKYQILSIIRDNVQHLPVFDSHEGTLLRMFNFNDKWYTSTHRKLDANENKWGSRFTFGEIFEKSLLDEVERNERLHNVLWRGTNIPEQSSSIVELFQTLLDKSRQYMFFIRNTADGRIVCNAPEYHTVYHIGTYIDNNLCLDDDVYLPKPNRHVFTDVSEMLTYANNVDISKIQGLIVFLPNDVQCKIINSEYSRLTKVRGNEPSLKFRYLQVRMDKNMRNDLYMLYPEFEDVFDNCENMLYRIAKRLYEDYVSRFIKHVIFSIPKDEFRVIKYAHDLYLSDKVNNRINLEMIINIMNNQTPTSLNHMIYNLRQCDESSIVHQSAHSSTHPSTNHPSSHPSTHPTNNTENTDNTSVGHIDTTPVDTQLSQEFTHRLSIEVNKNFVITSVKNNNTSGRLRSQSRGRGHHNRSVRGSTRGNNTTNIGPLTS
jgi:hypothetical protein